MRTVPAWLFIGLIVFAMVAPDQVGRWAGKVYFAAMDEMMDRAFGESK